jgi:hypothetical protein
MLRRGTAVLVPKLAKVFSIVIRERIIDDSLLEPAGASLSVEHRVGRG